MGLFWRRHFALGEIPSSGRARKYANHPQKSALLVARKRPKSQSGEKSAKWRKRNIGNQETWKSERQNSNYLCAAHTSGATSVYFSRVVDKIEMPLPYDVGHCCPAERALLDGEFWALTQNDVAKRGPEIRKFPAKRSHLVARKRPKF